MRARHIYRYGFEACHTLNEVDERKKKLAVLLHPDKGGDARLFQEAMAEATQRAADLTGGGRAESGQASQTDRTIDALVSSIVNSEQVRKAAADIVADKLRGLFGTR